MNREQRAKARQAVIDLNVEIAEHLEEMHKVMPQPLCTFCAFYVVTSSGGYFEPPEYDTACIQGVGQFENIENNWVGPDTPEHDLCRAFLPKRGFADALKKLRERLYYERSASRVKKLISSLPRFEPAVFEPATLDWEEMQGGSDDRRQRYP